MARHCAWCGLILTPGFCPENKQITHTICSHCVEQMVEEILEDDSVIKDGSRIVPEQLLEIDS